MNPQKSNNKTPAKTYANLNSKECLEASSKVLNEADIHLKTANENAELGNYGIAISTIIIGSEEMIKALILFLDGHGFEFRKVHKSTIFKNHNLRYLLAYVMFTMHIFGQELKRFLLIAVDNPQQAIEFGKKINSNEPEANKMLERYMLRIMVVIRKEFRWFQQMDSKRQSGLYSDFKQKLLLPSALGAQDFEQVKQRIVPARLVLKGMIASINTPTDEVTKVFTGLREKFKSQNRYKNIENWLGTLKEYKFDPFAAIFAATTKQ